jgi:hypothetical protein
MSTRRQIESNRRNAMRSTGPRTEAGIARSRSNAMKHGLRSTVLRHASEDGEAYRTFAARIIADSGAKSVIERQFAERFARNMWRQGRIDRIEDAINTEISEVLAQQAFDGGRLSAIDAPLGRLQLLGRYSAQSLREARLDYHELERLQARRRGEPVMAPVSVDHIVDVASSAESGASPNLPAIIVQNGND